MKKWINEEYNKISSRKATQGRLYLPPPTPLTSRKPLQINYNQPHPTPPTRPALPDEVSIIKTSRNLRHTLDTPMSEGAQWPTKKQTGWNPCFPSVSGILPVAATCDICVIALSGQTSLLLSLHEHMQEYSGGFAVKNFEDSSLLFFKNILVYTPFDEKFLLMPKNFFSVDEFI